jgi:hypothetical protein
VIRGATHLEQGAIIEAYQQRDLIRDTQTRDRRAAPGQECRDFVVDRLLPVAREQRALPRGKLGSGSVSNPASAVRASNADTSTLMHSRPSGTRSALRNTMEIDRSACPSQLDFA